MAEVSFYVLPTESLHDRYLFACKLIEKAYRSGSFCYVLTDSADQSRTLDDLLWTFRAGSFIPHQIYDGEQQEASDVTDRTILIGSLDAPDGWQKVVFNLSSRYPSLGPQTERVLEILDNSETTKAAGRTRYRQYQQAGIAIVTHKM